MTASPARRKTLLLSLAIAIIGATGTGAGLALIATIPHLVYEEKRPMNVWEMLGISVSVGCLAGLIVGVAWSVTILIRFFVSARLK